MGGGIGRIAEVGSLGLIKGGDIDGSNAANAAIGAQTSATNQANATQRYIFDTQRKDLEPWRQSGLRAIGQMEDQSFQRDFGMSDFQKDPGYQFRLQEGEKALNNAASARGMGNSGATLKALARYGQDFATNEYSNAYNRFNTDRGNRFSRLSTLAGMGQGANAQGGQAAQNYGNQVSANQIGLGNSIAAANINKSNQQMGMLTQGAGMAAMAFSDERLKTNIQEIPREEIQEMKKHLKAYAFNYVNDDYGTGDWVGVMAQDLEKSKLGKTLVVENEDGLKQIDLKKLLSMFLATMAEA